MSRNVWSLKLNFFISQHIPWQGFYCRIRLMSFVNPENSRLSRLLVLLLLLSAQSFSMAHELTHAPYSENGVLCEICSAGHGLDTAVTVAHFVPVSECAHELTALEPLAGQILTLSSPYIARAPPLKDVI